MLEATGTQAETEAPCVSVSAEMRAGRLQEIGWVAGPSLHWRLTDPGDPSRTRRCDDSSLSMRLRSSAVCSPEVAQVDLLGEEVLTHATERHALHFEYTPLLGVPAPTDDVVR